MVPSSYRSRTSATSPDRPSGYKSPVPPPDPHPTRRLRYPDSRRSRRRCHHPTHTRHVAGDIPQPTPSTSLAVPHPPPAAIPAVSGGDIEGCHSVTYPSQPGHVSDGRRTYLHLKPPSVSTGNPHYVRWIRGAGYTFTVVWTPSRVTVPCDTSGRVPPPSGVPRQTAISQVTSTERNGIAVRNTYWNRERTHIHQR